MRISKQLLTYFIKEGASLSAQEIADALTLKTVEVEDVERLGAGLAHIVVGRVEETQKHPDADRLLVCAVNIGSGKTVDIVCGGSNVEEGMLVAAALPGASVRWHGEGEPVVLKETKIRGVASFGMICASTEIGLGDQFPLSEEKEILDLSFLDAPPGTPVAAALGLSDEILVIDNKSLSNRPDLWGHYGLAREVAAMFEQPLLPYAPPKIKEGKATVAVSVKDAALCPRYTAVLVENVSAGSSPAWLQARLRALGVRPINTVVDITNYVMMEFGQPTHAFDADQLKFGAKGLEIQVRPAKKGESITALDGASYELTEQMLVIADAERPVAIAGVMGGQDSGVTQGTTHVLFESANFNATSIRRTALALGLRSESSVRFEKSLDPQQCERALRRLVELTLELCPEARVASRVADVSDYTLQQAPIMVSHAFIEDRLGITVPPRRVADILTRLGFDIKEKRGEYRVIAPSWRATKDINIKEDIVEEIGRIIGYDHIPSALPEGSIAPPPRNALRECMWRIRDILSLEFQYTETYNYSFVSPDQLQRMGEDVKKHFVLQNPIAKDRPLVRRHLLPNMLENVEMNLHRFDRVKLFEIGRGFRAEETGESAGPGEGNLPKQDDLLAFVYSEKDNDTPYYDVSESIRGLCERLGAANVTFKKTEHSHLVHNGRFAHIFVGDERVGFVGEIHPLVQERLGIAHRSAVAELSLEPLMRALSHGKTPYQSLPQFPPVERDIAFLAERDTEHAAIVHTLQGVSPVIESIALFDVYEGKGVPKGKKSMAYHITYRSAEATLTSNHIDEVHASVRAALEKEFGAQIR